MEPLISDLLREAAARLREIGAGNPYLEAEYLMEKALGEDRVRLLCRKEQSVSRDRAEAYRALVSRRLSREPLQYILGTVPFCDLTLAIGPGALIPRSETEILVEQVLKAVGGWDAESGQQADGARNAASGPRADCARETGPHADAPPAPPRLSGSRRLLIDVGTGSGAILLALRARLPGWAAIGVDCSREALAWARRNGVREAPLARGDLLSPFRPETADLVVSNPPYIDREELAALAPEIREHEPRAALDGGRRGLEIYARLVPRAAVVLKAGGLLALEMAPDQGESIARLLEDTGAYRDPAVFHDLGGRPRGVLVRKREGAEA